MSPSAVEVLLTSPDLLLGRWGNLSVTLWRDKPTSAGATSLERHYRSMITRYPSGFVSLIVIGAGTPAPDESIRKLITSTMDGAGDHLLSVGVVLEAQGFAAAALRAALTSMSMLTRSRFPRRFVSSVGEALEWLSASVRDDEGRPAQRMELARAVDELRRVAALSS